MNTLPLNILYYGKTDPLPVKKELQVGPLSVMFEDGALRYVKLGSYEILREIYVAVRDRNWGTVPGKLSNLEIEETDNSFSVSFDMEHEQDDINFFWHGKIKAETIGTLSFIMDGEARSTFKRNRIGICVLHPINGCAGKPCRIEKVDGQIEETSFPDLISPHQPFLDLKAITHEVDPGVWAEVKFSGDVFETEDQRNWTDASFKTYSTPLALPFPVEIKKETKIFQSVELHLKGIEEKKYVKDSKPESFFLDIGQPSTIPLPRIGLGMSSYGQPLTQNEIVKLKLLNLSHLRLDLYPSNSDYPSLLKQATMDAVSLGVELEIALFLSEKAEDELMSLAAQLNLIKPKICTWLVFKEGDFSTNEQLMGLAREYLSNFNPKAKIGSGTNAWFTQLNRNRPQTELLDLISYAVSPQVHAFDNTTLIENLEGIAFTVENMHQITGGKVPLSISPITLKPRFNPSATDPKLNPLLNGLPTAVDVRQMSLFGAGWTAGSLKYLAENQVYSATYYETIGWRGVMECETGSREPNAFHSLPGAVFPIYHVLADVGEFAGGMVIPTRSSDSHKLIGLGIYKNGKSRIILANLCEEVLRVSVGKVSESVYVRHLNEKNAESCMLKVEEFRNKNGDLIKSKDGILNLELLPFAIASIDWY
jgi:D-apionolactonase